jgi:hypothetical protein
MAHYKQPFFVTLKYANSYGTDPDLVVPSVPWTHTLTEEQKILAAALSDIILPSDNGFPAPSDMGIIDFLNEWVSAPYPQQQTDKELLVSGFALIDSDSMQRFGLNFVALTEQDKRKIVDELSGATGSDSASQKRVFFKRFRYLVVGGYFTSDVGYRAIGYIGNVPMSNYPSISSEVNMIIEEELARLGISSNL